MTSRQLPRLYDNSSRKPSLLLNNTLFGFVPEEANYAPHTLPRGYHLVYFAPATPSSSLLPDGTDPLHSPGPPYTRRMWAGGDIEFSVADTKFTNGPLRCSESITDVEIKGTAGAEKVFVNIQRSIHYMTGKRLARRFIVENRKLVFMRDHSRPPEVPPTATAPRTVVKPPHEPEFSHTLTPSPALLFRFSALTFNAHAIHLDKQYCRDVEGHRNLLVHGPLTVVLMLQILQGYQRTKAKGEGTAPRVVTHIEYRNLAPLYAEEEMKVCVKQKDESLWETWIEGPDGGLAVRGTVTTPPALTKAKGDEEAKGVEEIPTTAEEGALN